MMNVDVEDREAGYDAQRDAARMGRDIESWADHGFLAGLLSSSRRPDFDQISWRSSAFSDAYANGIGDFASLGRDEIDRRLTYGDQVREILYRIETASISRRYRLLGSGMLARLVLQLMIMLFAVAIALTVSEVLAITLFAIALLADALAGIPVARNDGELYEKAFVKKDPTMLPWLPARDPGKA